MPAKQIEQSTYETVFILKSDISDSDAKTVDDKISSVIKKFEGDIKSKDDWGLRDLAYPINKETMGRYQVVVYHGKAGVVEEIERHFKIFPNVIRWMSVAVANDYDYGKAKKEIQTSEEELRKAREARKKGN